MSRSSSSAGITVQRNGMTGMNPKQCCLFAMGRDKSPEEVCLLGHSWRK